MHGPGERLLLRAPFRGHAKGITLHIVEERPDGWLVQVQNRQGRVVDSFAIRQFLDDGRPLVASGNPEDDLPADF